MNAYFFRQVFHGREHTKTFAQPGDVGEEKFDNFCSKVKAMYGTIEGQAVISAIKAFLKAKPLELKVSVEEVVSE